MKNLPTLEEMLKAGMHFGHKTSKWHPKMAPFIFGQRNGIHIIDLSKSQKMLDQALEQIKQLTKEEKTILFVGTKNQVKEPLKKMAEENNMPYVSERWLGGTLTNFAIIKLKIKKYKDLLDKKETGKLAKYTKKEQLEFEEEIKDLQKKVGGLSKMNKLPDAIFIWDIKEEETAVKESAKMKIPTIAVCDTNTNPTTITHIIPSNDDATKTIKLMVKLIDEAIKEGKAEIKK